MEDAGVSKKKKKIVFDSRPRLRIENIKRENDKLPWEDEEDEDDDKI